jgi:ABC-type multidrug transport system ATPase subunit
LDEPTAALDAKSENLIRDSLMQMIQDKTVFMVTHRRSLLTLMDVIYVLDNGTMTDVRELGGLDRYLAQLEGIEEKKIGDEITESKKTTTKVHAVDLYKEYVDAHVPEETITVKEPIQEAMPAHADGIQPPIVSHPVEPWSPKKSREAIQRQPTQRPANQQTTQPSEARPTQQQRQNNDDDETVIRLHDN